MEPRHNDATGPCHAGCCDGPQDGCPCWNCDPAFDWDQYESHEAAAAAIWGEVGTGSALAVKPAPEPPSEAVEDQKRNRGMANYHASHRGHIPRAGG